MCKGVLLFLSFILLFPSVFAQKKDSEIAIILKKQYINTKTPIEVIFHKKMEQAILLLNGKELEDIAPKDGKWTYELNTDSLLDGTYKLQVKAIFAKKEYLSSVVSVTVDKTDPKVTFEKFIQRSKEQVTFYVKGSDVLSGMEKIEFFINKKSIGTGKREKEQYERSWKIPENSRGYHLLEIHAFDKAGNKKSISEKIRLDLQGPRIKVLAPLAQGPLREFLTSEVDVSDTAGVAKVNFLLKERPHKKGMLWQNKNKWGCKWDKLKDGKYKILVTATDKLGNTNQVVIYAEIDQTAPIIEWITPEQKVITSKAIPIKINIVDDSNILEVKLVSKKIKPILLKKKGELWVLDYTPEKEGKDSLVIKVKDIAGNTADSKPLDIIYDITPPRGKLSYRKNSYYSKPFEVKVIASDELSDVKSVILLLNGTKQIVSTKTPYGWKATVNIKQSGKHTLGAMVIDKAGNKSRILDEILLVDKKSPSITLQEKGQIIFGEKSHVRFQVKDSISKVISVTASINYRNVATQKNPSENCQLTWDNSSFGEGKYDFILEAVDSAGNVATLKRNVLIDRTPPKVSGNLNRNSIQIGRIEVSLLIEDKPSGVDYSLKPKIYMDLHGKTYPFSVGNFQGSTLRGKIEITRKHPEGDARVYIEGIKDLAGHETKKILLASFTIKGAGGSWPIAKAGVKEIFGVYTKGIDQTASGIWIASEPDKPVRSIEDGKVVEVFVSKNRKRGYILVKRLRGDLVWGYYNLQVAKNPSFTRNSKRKFWNVGDIISAGEVIGHVAPVAKQSKSYLYLTLLTWKNENWVPIDSPIKYLRKSEIKKVSPKPLLENKRIHTCYFSDLDFTVSKDFKQAQIPKGKYHLTDLFIIIYSILLLGTLMTIGIISRSKNQF